MPRPTRRLINTCAAAALLLFCLATAALWVRSYWVVDAVYVDTARGRTSLGSARGRLFIDRITFTLTPARRPPLSPGPGYHALRPFTPSNTFAPRWQWAGFSWTSTSVSIYTVTDLRIPDWAILTPAALVLAWIVRRRLRAVPPGHCPHCRYDLTGNVSGVCPECGTPHSTGRDVLRAE